MRVGIFIRCTSPTQGGNMNYWLIVLSVLNTGFFFFLSIILLYDKRKDAFQKGVMTVSLLLTAGSISLILGQFDWLGLKDVWQSAVYIADAIGLLAFLVLVVLAEGYKDTTGKVCITVCILVALGNILSATYLWQVGWVIRLFN